MPLTKETALGSGVDAVNEAYFHNEVAPHLPDAWIDKCKTDDKDEQVGIVGYEIPFVRLFSGFLEIEPSGGRIKLKTLISKSPLGKYAWNSVRVNFQKSVSGGSDVRFDFDEKYLDPEFFSTFLSSPDNDDWRKYASVGAVIPAVPFTRLTECEVDLPDLKTQQQIVRLRKEYDAVSYTHLTLPTKA